MITGEPTRGDFNRVRKAYFRTAKASNEYIVLKIEKEQTLPEITFGHVDVRAFVRPHDDALVITTNIIRHIVSLCRYGECCQCDLSRMLWPNILYSSFTTCSHNIYVFTGEVVSPMGSIELMVPLGDKTSWIARPTQFLIIDAPSTYNVILGRPTLNAFTIVSILYI